ncbi:MAG: TonB C-terminal domain-containing protein [Desulfovibrionaceae bacterium]|nr:TonB C-terminal domain-containing protein [Desulfovibrionaceae bacterium]
MFPTLQPLHLLAPALVAGCLTAAPALAVAVSADSSGGYGAQVMDIILANWTKPADATGSTSVIVRITNDGKPFSCELRKSSGKSGVDDAVCMAVAKAGIFPPTPYAAPAEVALTFVYDDAGAPPATAQASAQAPAKSYADILMDNARPHISLPEGLQGEYSATVRLLVQPDGTLAEYKMEKPSGSSAFDAAVLRALLQPGVITLPPEGKEQNVYLTFSLAGH